MKLVFVGNGLYRSDNYPTPMVGGSVQTWGLAKELAKRGHEICIIRRSNIKEVIICDDVRLIGIDFYGIDSLRIPFYGYIFYMGMYPSKIYFSKKSLDLILKNDLQIVCFIDSFTGIFPSLLLRRLKVFIMHTPDALDFFKPYYVLTKKLNVVNFYLKKIVQSKIMNNVDKIVVLNSFIEGYLKKIGYSHVCKIPNGVDIEHFSNRRDGGFILYAGRFDWNKNVCSLVKAFAEFHKEHRDYDLYLVGEGTEEKRIRSLVKEENLQSCVKIIPWLPRKKLADTMSKCSVFVLPSFFEVNPVVVLEAMASGKPIIARANMGTVDIITHGKDGFLYNKDEELRNHLEMLLSDYNLRKKIGRNARRTVEQEYTFSHVANKYEELFYTLIKNRDRYPYSSV